MIQSRAQFGTRGAVVPFIAVLFVYIGFNVFNVILATQSLRLIRRTERGFSNTDVGGCIFVPLVGEGGFRAPKGLAAPCKCKLR